MPRVMAEPPKVINLMEDLKRSLAQDAEGAEEGGRGNLMRAKAVLEPAAQVPKGRIAIADLRSRRSLGNQEFQSRILR